jgi:hypothetical protein
VQHRLIVSLAGLGLIQTERSGYVLAEDFEWPSRFLLLHKAYAQWNEKIALRRQDRKGLAPSTIALMLKGESEQDAYAHIDTLPAATSPAPQYVNPILAVPVPASVKSSPLVAPVMPEAPVLDAAMLRAKAALTDVQLRRVAAHADIIFFELLLLIAKQGPALRFSTIDAVATILAKGTKNSIKLVSRVLRGREVGAPLLFHIYPIDGDCIVRMLAISEDEWTRLPRTKRALSLLGKEVAEGLENPESCFINEHVAEVKPVLSVTQMDKTTRLEHENQVHVNRHAIADVVYEAVTHRITQDSATLHYSRINELAMDIAKVSRTTVASVMDVLAGRYKGIPRVFRFDFSGKTNRCRVRLIALESSLVLLPRTKLALQQFQANIAAEKRRMVALALERVDICD